MDLWLYIGFLVLLLVGFIIWATLFSNPTTAGRGFLDKHLQRCGVDTKAIPDELKDEMVDRAKSSARFASMSSHGQVNKRILFNAEFEKFLSIEGEWLAYYLEGPQSPGWRFIFEDALDS